MSTDPALDRKYRELLRGQHRATLTSALPVLADLAQHQSRELGFLRAAAGAEPEGGMREVLQVEAQRERRYLGFVTRVRKHLASRSWNKSSF